MNFEKLKEVYVHKMSSYKNLSHFSNSYYGFGNIKQCWKALFAENSSLSHHFAENIVTNKKYFIQN